MQTNRAEANSLSGCVEMLSRWLKQSRSRVTFFSPLPISQACDDACFALPTPKRFPCVVASRLFPTFPPMGKVASTLTPRGNSWCHFDSPLDKVQALLPY